MARRTIYSSPRESHIDDASRHHLLSETESASPEKHGPHFKRVKPRIGAQFQTKLTKKIQDNHDKCKDESSSSVRPAPEPMSTLIPYVTQQQVERGHKRARVSCHDRQGYDPTSSSTSRTTHESSPHFPLEQQLPRRFASNTNLFTQQQQQQPPPQSHRRQGGTCLHRASTDTNDYLVYCQHLVLPLPPCPPDSNDTLAIESWKQEMIRRHGSTASSPPKSRRVKQSTTTTAATTGRGRGRRKRKAAAAAVDKDDSNHSQNAHNSHLNNQGGLLWGISSSLSGTTASMKEQSQSQQQDQMLMDLRTKRSPQHLEDDPAMLQYLHQQHNGNVETARLSILVNLATGRAHKARRCERKQQHKERFRQPNPETSQSWRKRYERTHTTMIGDVRRRRLRRQTLTPRGEQSDEEEGDTATVKDDDAQEIPKPYYPYTKNLAQEEEIENKSVPVIASDIDCNDFEAVEDLKGVWRSVLSCGQTTERMMGAYLENSNRLSSPQRPSLSEAITFVRNAYSLPTPEKVFGTRHIVVGQISMCLNAMLDHVAKARNVQTKIMDKLYDEKQEGIDLDALRKTLDETNRNLPIRIDEVDILDQQLGIIAEWQSRLDALTNESSNSNNNNNKTTNTSDDDTTSNTRNDIYAKNSDKEEIPPPDTLAAAERLLEEGRKMTLRSKNLLVLEKKMEKAYKLRDRIREWLHAKQEGKKESIKFVAAMVREANRMDFSFPEMDVLLQFHRTTEEWVDRANIAIRSRISLSEIESLVEQGTAMPLDLSEFLDKLNSRLRLAHEWMDRFQSEVPCQYLSCGSKVDNLSWMSKMRAALLDSSKDGAFGHLLELSSEGSRIPVEIDPLKMLQLEIDAKNWSLKGKKWIKPSNESSSLSATATETAIDNSAGRKGKVEDLREHVEKAEALREKLWLSEDEKEAWKLEGEDALISIVEEADGWFEKYASYLGGDNRRNEARSCISLPKLKQIVDEANAIHANIGSACSKITRIAAQAESWYEKHESLLLHCGIVTGDVPSVETSSSKRKQGDVTLAKINAAVEEAYSEVSLDLEEALELKSISERVEKWFGRTLLAAPKRNKRNVKAKWGGKPQKITRYPLEELISLIDEAPTLPVDTNEELQRLQVQLNTVQTWRLRAQGEIYEIAEAFENLRESVNLSYGTPTEFLQEETDTATATAVSEEAGPGVVLECSEQMDVEETTSSPIGVPEDSTTSESGSLADTGSESGPKQKMNGSGGRVPKLIEILIKDAKSNGIYTAEEKVAERLAKVSKWYVRSLKYIVSPKDLYEKKTFTIFDKFIVNGDELAAQCAENADEIFGAVDDAELVKKLKSSWAKLMEDQLVRLQTLQSHRDHFIAWSQNTAELLASKEKRISMETLEKLAKECSNFPSATDMVQKVQALAGKASSWVESTNGILESGEKLTMDEAKALFDKGDKLKVSCKELKILRNEIRTARGWATRVKRSKLDQGSTKISDVQALVEEHDALLINMPDVVKKLQQALRGYCICRRPYEGFMIGCDDCDEWYHGGCIGVSESQAGRYEKYTCLKCNLKRVFKISSGSIVSVIRKWISPKDLKKARQGNSQKHQRKVRKEHRDMEKLQPEIESLEKELNGIINGQPSGTPDGLNLASGMDPAQTVDSTKVESCKASGVVGGGQSNGNANHIAGTVTATAQAENDATADQIVFKNDMNTTSNSPSIKEDKDEVKDSSEKENSPIDPAVMEAKLKKAKAALQHCYNRLETLSKQSAKRKSIELQEDMQKDALRQWCLLLSCSIIIPTRTTHADESRPLLDGKCSEAMLSVAKTAEALGIQSLPDVSVVTNALGCISWSYRAMAILVKKPTILEIRSLISQSESLKLPEEKAPRAMKAMIQRASGWQAKAWKVLAPKPGETQPCCVTSLKELLPGLRNIPMVVPEESRLLNAIEDDGARHCLCGGPSDGSFMLGCDKCDRWYHGRCLNIGKDAGDIEDWICPPCSGSTQPCVVLSQNELDAAILADCEDDNDEDDEREKENSSDPANPIKMWPPYGLLHTDEAQEALGKEAFTVLEFFSRDKESFTAGTFVVKEEVCENNLAETKPLLELRDLGNFKSEPLIVSPELSSLDEKKIDENDVKASTSATRIIVHPNMNSIVAAMGPAGHLDKPTEVVDKMQVSSGSNAAETSSVLGISNLSETKVGDKNESKMEIDQNEEDTAGDNGKSNVHTEPFNGTNNVSISSISTDQIHAKLQDQKIVTDSPSDVKIDVNEVSPVSKKEDTGCTSTILDADNKHSATTFNVKPEEKHKQQENVAKMEVDSDNNSGYGHVTATTSSLEESRGTSDPMEVEDGVIDTTKEQNHHGTDTKVKPEYVEIGKEGQLDLAMPEPNSPAITRCSEPSNSTSNAAGEDTGNIRAIERESKQEVPCTVGTKGQGAASLATASVNDLDSVEGAVKKNDKLSAEAMLIAAPPQVNVKEGCKVALQSVP